MAPLQLEMTTSAEVEDLIDVAAQDIAAAVPSIRTLVSAAARAFEQGDIETAVKFLEPTLKMLGRMSKFMVLLQERLAARPQEAELHAAGLAAANEGWAALLNELSGSVKAGDFLKTADILTFEFPPAFDQQAAYFSLLSEHKP